MKFKNIDNNYTEDSPCPWVWTLLFGWMYFAYKRAYLMAFIWILTVVPTIGVAALIFPFFANRIIRQAYLRNGWTELTTNQQ